MDQPKFKFDDEVYLIIDQDIRKGRVETITHSKKLEAPILYGLSGTGYIMLDTPEHHLFPSAEALVWDLIQRHGIDVESLIDEPEEGKPIEPHIKIKGEYVTAGEEDLMRLLLRRGHLGSEVFSSESRNYIGVILQSHNFDDTEAVEEWERWHKSKTKTFNAR